MVVGPDWKGETPAGIKKVFHLHDAVHRRDLSHSALQPGRHAERQQDSGRLQGAAALRVPGPARPTGRAGIDFPVDKDPIKTNFFQYLDFALEFAPPLADESGNPRQARQHRRRTGQDV